MSFLSGLVVPLELQQGHFSPSSNWPQFLTAATSASTLSWGIFFFLVSCTDEEWFHHLSRCINRLRRTTKNSQSQAVFDYTRALRAPQGIHLRVVPMASGQPDLPTTVQDHWYIRWGTVQCSSLEIFTSFNRYSALKCRVAFSWHWSHRPNKELVL